MGSGTERFKHPIFCLLIGHHEESHGAEAGRLATKTRVPFWHRGHRGYRCRRFEASARELILRVARAERKPRPRVDGTLREGLWIPLPRHCSEPRHSGKVCASLAMSKGKTLSLIFDMQMESSIVYPVSWPN